MAAHSLKEPIICNNKDAANEDKADIGKIIIVERTLCNIGIILIITALLIPAISMFSTMPSLSVLMTRIPFPSSSNLICNDAACFKESHYYENKFDRSVDPCDDFYSFVCSAKWYQNEGDRTQLPYRDQTLYSLYSSVESLVNSYTQRNAEYLEMSNRHHFGHQMIMFINSCLNTTARSHVDYETLRAIFRSVNLHNWPFVHNPSPVNVAEIAGKVAATLGVSPFVSVSVERSRTPGNMATFLALGDAQLVLPLSVLLSPDADKSNEFKRYRKMVEKTVDIFHAGKNADAVVRTILEMERSLARLVDIPRRHHVDSPYYLIKMEHLSDCSNWRWRDFFRPILKGVSAPETLNLIGSTSIGYLDNFILFMMETTAMPLLNYLGFRIILELAPLLPSRLDFLVGLPERTPHGQIQLRACVKMAEKLFGPDALALIIRHVHESNVFKDETQRKTITTILGVLDMSIRQKVKVLSWMTEHDKNVSLQQLQTVTISIGLPKVNESIISQHFVSLPVIETSKLLQSYALVKSQALRKTWNALDKRSRYIVRRGGLSSVKVGYRVHNADNHIQLPFSIFSFLQHQSEAVLPLQLPRFLSLAATALLRSLLYLRQRSSSPHGLSWSMDSGIEYSHIAWCYRVHYDSYLEQILGVTNGTGDYVSEILDEIVAQNAAIDVLFDTYRASFSVIDAKIKPFRLPGAINYSPEQLFFINLALGFCGNTTEEQDASQLYYEGELSSRYRLNGLLRNSHLFAKTMECKPDTRMNPHEKCRFWN